MEISNSLNVSTLFSLGIISTIVALVLFSKPIIKFAAKRSMKNLVGSIQGKVNKFAESMDNIPIETDPDKILEDN